MAGEVDFAERPAPQRVALLAGLTAGVRAR